MYFRTNDLQEVEIDLKSREAVSVKRVRSVLEGMKVTDIMQYRSCYWHPLWDFDGGNMPSD